MSQGFLGVTNTPKTYLWSVAVTLSASVFQTMRSWTSLLCRWRQEVTSLCIVRWGTVPQSWPFFSLMEASLELSLKKSSRLAMSKSPMKVPTRVLWLRMDDLLWASWGWEVRTLIFSSSYYMTMCRVKCEEGCQMLLVPTVNVPHSSGNRGGSACGLSE